MIVLSTKHQYDNPFEQIHAITDTELENLVLFIDQFSPLFEPRNMPFCVSAKRTLY